MDYVEMAEDLLRLCAEQLKSAVGQQAAKFTQGELLALCCLGRREDGTYPRELSHELHVSSARIAAMLRDMQEKGWIVRRDDPEDSRHILVALTPRGRDEIKVRRERTLGSLAQVLERLGPEDAKALIRILRRMNKICFEYS